MSLLTLCHYGSLPQHVNHYSRADRYGPDLEPAFENLLRTLNIDESLNKALRINMITDRETFIGLDDTEAGFKSIGPDLGIDLTNGGFAHKREMSRLISAWKQARLASEAKQHVDAVAKAHRVPSSFLPEDWTSMMLAFRNKFGKHIPDEKLPAQSNYEAFADKLAIGALKAEPMAMVVSAFDKEQQEKNKPEPVRQYGLSLDSKLTLTTKKRIVSSEPANEKDLRDKYAIMTNMWLLGQMKQPGRSIYRDLDRLTFIDFLEKLHDKKNFNLHKEVNGTLLLVPKWTDCLSYEFEIRKEAFRLCREVGFGIKAALWNTITNNEHRMIQWLQLFSIANSRSGGGDYAALERKMNDLQRSSRAISITPETRCNRRPKALTAPSQWRSQTLPTRGNPASAKGTTNLQQELHLPRVSNS